MAGTETPTMQLVSDRLQRSKARTNLEAFLKAARAKTEDHKPETWDDIAFEIRSHTGTRVVRESVRSWAIRYGIDPVRPSNQPGDTTDEPAA